MEIKEFRDLHKYTLDGLIKIAVHNGLYSNEYYLSKKELKAAIYNCLLADERIVVPDNMTCKDFIKV